MHQSLISTTEYPATSVDRHATQLNDYMEGLSAGSVLAYSSAHQNACCRSLIGLGFGDISLNQIEKYVDSARSWSVRLKALLDDGECRLFFPQNSLSMNTISQLARLHDQNAQPCTAVVCMDDLPRVTQKLGAARQEARMLRARLSVQRYWIDTHRLPLTEQTLAYLYALAQQGKCSPRGRLRRHALSWIRQFLQPGASFATHLACGNVSRLVTLVEQAVQFARCREYRRAFGSVFCGLDTNWEHLRGNIAIYNEVRQVLESGGVDQRVLSNWEQYESHFFSLCRKASTVQRRLHKLNRLVKRQYFTPAEPEGYFTLAQKSVSRLFIWLTVLKSTSGSGKLTPQQLLANPEFKNSRFRYESH